MQLKPLGDGFIKLIKMLIAPIIFATVVSGIGGMGNLLGAFVGGLLVGVSESLGAVLLVPSLKEIVGFVLLGL